MREWEGEVWWEKSWAFHFFWSQRLALASIPFPVPVSCLSLFHSLLFNICQSIFYWKIHTTTKSLTLGPGWAGLPLHAREWKPQPFESPSFSRLSITRYPVTPFSLVGTLIDMARQPFRWLVACFLIESSSWFTHMCGWRPIDLERDSWITWHLHHHRSIHDLSPINRSINHSTNWLLSLHPHHSFKWDSFTDTHKLWITEFILVVRSSLTNSSQKQKTTWPKWWSRIWPLTHTWDCECAIWKFWTKTPKIEPSQDQWPKWVRVLRAKLRHVCISRLCIIKWGEDTDKMVALVANRRFLWRWQNMSSTMWIQFLQRFTVHRLFRRIFRRHSHTSNSSAIPTQLDIIINNNSWVNGVEESSIIDL